VHVGMEEAVAENLGENSSTPVAASFLKSTPAARMASSWPMGMPSMRSITITFVSQ